MFEAHYLPHFGPKSSPKRIQSSQSAMYLDFSRSIQEHDEEAEETC